MTAQDYSVNFPYGATSAPYGTKALPYHRGNDRPTPTGTPVLINGIQLGLTGATGLVTGPHLHIQEWKDSVYNDRNPQNEFKPGTVVATSTDVSQQWGKYVTVRNADGWNDTYCHLSRIDVNVGQVIGEDMVTGNQLDILFQRFNGVPPNQTDRNKFEGQSLQAVLDYLTTNPTGKAYTDKISSALDNSNDGYETVKETLYRKK